MIIFLSSVAVALLFTFPIIWLKLGQPVREEGPAAHQTKAGTPTMGGIGFILAILVLSIILLDIDLHPQYLALILLILSFAVIGLTDDLLKVVRRQNLGLTFWQKIFWQVAAAATFALFLTFQGENLTILYPFMLTFIIVGSANATNLTDGLNGLLSGTGGIAFLSFAFLAAKFQDQNALVFSLICAGAILSFLYFNFPKAKMFMGDVGSLAIGAALAGLAALLHKELQLAVIGGIFVIEALSVILQVASCRFFKRRILKMSPLHHHFELCGLSETIIVVGFWIAGAILGLVGLFI